MLSLLDLVDPLKTMFPPELYILRNHDPAGSDSPPPRVSLPFPFAPRPPQEPGLASLPRLPSVGEWPVRDAEEQHPPLNLGLSVQCEEHKMVVSIQKESLQVRQTSRTLFASM